MRAKCFSFKLSRQCYKIFPRFFRKSTLKHFLSWKLFGFSRLDWRQHCFSVLKGIVYIIVSWPLSRRRGNLCSVIVNSKGWLIAAVSLSLVIVIVIKKHKIRLIDSVCLWGTLLFGSRRDKQTDQETRGRDYREEETGQRGLEGIIFSFSLSWETFRFTVPPEVALLN